MVQKHWTWRLGALGARVFLGLIFFTGGISKLMPFPGVMGPVWLEEVLEPHGLGLYARFIAWSETIIGLLLMSHRLTTLGAIMLVPMVVNIFMVTTSMNWQGTPYVVGFFALLNLYLIAYDYPRWKWLVLDGVPRDAGSGHVSTTPRVEACGLAGVILPVVAPLVFAYSSVLAYMAVGSGFMLLLLGALGRRRLLRAACTDPLRVDGA